VFALLVPIGSYIYFLILTGVFINLNATAFNFLSAVAWGTSLYILISIPILAIVTLAGYFVVTQMEEEG